jgi:site-specific DNA recombinase
MANAVIYCRVSTDDQEKEGTSLTTQREACVKYCQDKGYAHIKTFSETYTGTTLDRPQLTDLRDLVAAGEVNVIVIYCLDRISRDPTHAAILFQEFERLAVRTEAVTETIENTDMGKLISYIRGFASKLEVEKIRERTSRGKTARLKEGQLPTGTGIGAYGYQWDKPTKKRVIVPEEADIVRRIFSMILQGRSLSQIAKSLNEDGITTKAGLSWCHTTVRRTATNPIYAGETYYGRRKRVGKNKVQALERDKWISLPDVTPAIINKATFDTAQEALQRTHPQTRKTESTYFLTGLMFCPECGSPICGATLNGKYRYYRCRGTMPTRTRAAICNAKYIRADEVEPYVWDRFANLVSSPLTVLSTFTDLGYDSSKRANMVPIIDKQLKALHNRLKTYEPRERKLYNILHKPQVTEEYVLDAVDKLKNQQQEDKRQIDELLDLRKQQAQVTKINVTLSKYSEDLKAAMSANLSTTQKRQFLQAYEVRVTASPGKYTFTTMMNMTSEDWDEDLETYVVDSVKKLEAQHPDITITDLADHSEMLPNDHPLTRTSNEIKQQRIAAARQKPRQPSTKKPFTTIGQTSA